MAKIIISLAVLTALSLFAFCDAAPRSLDVNDFKNLTAAIETEEFIRYDGAQLWSVEFGDHKTKRIVVDLKKIYGSFLSFCFVLFVAAEKKIPKFSIFL